MVACSPSQGYQISPPGDRCLGWNSSACGPRSQAEAFDSVNKAYEVHNGECLAHQNFRDKPENFS